MPLGSRASYEGDKVDCQQKRLGIWKIERDLTVRQADRFDGWGGASRKDRVWYILLKSRYLTQAEGITGIRRRCCS